MNANNLYNAFVYSRFIEFVNEAEANPDKIFICDRAPFSNTIYTYLWACKKQGQVVNYSDHTFLSKATEIGDILKLHNIYKDSKVYVFVSSNVPNTVKQMKKRGSLLDPPNGIDYVRGQTIMFKTVAAIMDFSVLFMQGYIKDIPMLLKTELSEIAKAKDIAEIIDDQAMIDEFFNHDMSNDSEYAYSESDHVIAVSDDDEDLPSPKRIKMDSPDSPSDQTPLLVANPVAMQISKKNEKEVICDNHLYVTREKVGYQNDAGYDLFLSEDTFLRPGMVEFLKVDNRFKIPKGYYGSIATRSSMMVKGLVVLNGVIDSGYTGPIQVAVFNTGKDHKQFKKGDRVAQVLVIKLFEGPVHMKSNDFIGEIQTERGTKGFGSTNKFAF